MEEYTLECLTVDRQVTYGIVKPGEFHPSGVPMVRSQDLVKVFVPLRCPG